MQLEPLIASGGTLLRIPVKAVTANRMADPGQVNPELMRTAGFRLQHEVGAYGVGLAGGRWR